MNQLVKDYSELLKKAEETTSRREAVYLIRQADRVRQEICRHPEYSMYPVM